MVRHDHITANKPCRGVSPNLAKKVVDILIGKPGFPVFRANGVEDDCRLAINVENAMRWMFALWEIGVGFGHCDIPMS
jgi:hypothetical protein